MSCELCPCARTNMLRELGVVVDLDHLYVLLIEVIWWVLVCLFVSLFTTAHERLSPFLLYSTLHSNVAHTVYCGIVQDPNIRAIVAINISLALIHSHDCAWMCTKNLILEDSFFTNLMALYIWEI